ncbi:metal-sulfur cluster assembly factor [Nocardia sp. CA-107356]|uniref:metal-sulfur cluster assembly factor n=1 Tax=Nocardia sp. CA-107356 TaxID=3239972 RepID=UPI003D916B1B
MEALSTVYDGCCEERKISIVDMGLVDKVFIDHDSVVVELVLTTGWCPFSIRMLGQAHDRVAELPGVNQVAVKVNWDESWDSSRAAPWLAKAFELLPQPSRAHGQHRTPAVAPAQTPVNSTTADTTEPRR